MTQWNAAVPVSFSAAASPLGRRCTGRGRADGTPGWCLTGVTGVCLVADVGSRSLCADRALCRQDQRGVVQCPVLRAYTCPTCGARGDNAHTIKYCPQRPVCKPVLPRMIRKTVHY